VPAHFIGGVSFDESAFGIAPELSVDRVTARIRHTLDAIRKESA
jgi:hypothetical protein